MDIKFPWKPLCLTLGAGRRPLAWHRHSIREDEISSIILHVNDLTRSIAAFNRKEFPYNYNSVLQVQAKWDFILLAASLLSLSVRSESFKYHVTPKTSSTSLRLKNVCAAETRTGSEGNNSGKTGASERTLPHQAKPPCCSIIRQIKNWLSSLKKPKNDAWKQKNKQTKQKSGGVFCSPHFEVVSVLPLA